MIDRTEQYKRKSLGSSKTAESMCISALEIRLTKGPNAVDEDLLTLSKQRTKCKVQNALNLHLEREKACQR